jgi:hypothetical protein
MSEPTHAVSWLLIRKGWAVDAADRAGAGTVRSVAGDANADIFDGVVVRAGDRTVYVEAAKVTGIRDGHVGVAASARDLAAMPAFQASDELRILPESASFRERLTGWFRRDSP